MGGRAEGGREGERKVVLLPPGMTRVKAPALLALLDLRRSRQPAQNLAHKTLRAVVEITLREGRREGGRVGGVGCIPW